MQIHTFTPILPAVVSASANPYSILARRVWSGTRPSFIHSTRLSSAPLMRPLASILMPSTPISIAVRWARFIARFTVVRRTIWSAMDSATSCALASASRTSTTSTKTSLPVSFESFFRRRSISSPPLPITMPGRAVWMLRRTRLA